MAVRPQDDRAGLVQHELRGDDAHQVDHPGNVTIDARDALRRMAEDYGTTPAQTLEDLLTFCLEDDAAIARRTLLRIERKTTSAPGTAGTKPGRIGDRAGTGARCAGVKTHSSLGGPPITLTPPEAALSLGTSGRRDKEPRERKPRPVIILRPPRSGSRPRAPSRRANPLGRRP